MFAFIRQCTLALLLLIWLPVLSCGQAGGAQLRATEFNKSLAAQPEAQLLDVRRPDEFEGGHLPGAVNMNYQAEDFESSAQALDKTRPVYVYCRSGSRSAAAASILRETGFKNVYELKGGIKAWEKAGLQIER